MHRPTNTWWGRSLLNCRSVRRKLPGEQWSRRETVEARVTKWNFDVEMHSGISGPQIVSRPDEEMPTATARWKFPQYLHLHLRQKSTCLKCVVKECTRKHSGSELSGQKSAELLNARHVRLPVRRSHTFVNARRIKMPGTRAAEQHQRRRRRSKTTSVTDNENLANKTNVVAKAKMVICDPSYTDPAKTKVIGKVIRHTHLLGAPFPDLLNKVGNLIDSGQIVIAQKLLERNDIYVMMVSWGLCATSKDRYITIESTDAVTAVIYFGFEYRSVHDGDRRGFTVKPTAKYVDECLDIVQLQNAKAVMTPLTEQKSLNLNDETTMCDQVQHSLFRAVVGKLQYITVAKPDLMFETKMFVIQTCVTNTCRLDTCREGVEIFERYT